MLRSFFLWLLIILECAFAAHWAVLVVGSRGYYNYRHQADICHAYQILLHNGVHPKRVILMMADDVAFHENNPLKGRLFNRPSGHQPGKDVYQGCDVEFSGQQVSVSHFEAVLLGDKSRVPAGLRVLESSPEDRVFVNFVDHGSEGSLMFPYGEELGDVRLNKILTKMHEKRMYKEMVLYVEACESGSMFDRVQLPPNMYAVTAANATESSWGTYCPDYKHPSGDLVEGHHIGSCLGDLFSVNWMEDTDEADINRETVGEQTQKVLRKTKLSHVQVFGERVVAAELLREFLGGESQLVKAVRPDQPLDTEQEKRLVEEFSPRHMYNQYFQGNESLDLDDLKEKTAVPASKVEIHIAYVNLMNMHVHGVSRQEAQSNGGSEAPREEELEEIRRLEDLKRAIEARVGAIARRRERRREADGWHVGVAQIERERMLLA